MTEGIELVHDTRQYPHHTAHQYIPHRHLGPLVDALQEGEQQSVLRHGVHYPDYCSYSAETAGEYCEDQPGCYHVLW